MASRIHPEYEQIVPIDSGGGGGVFAGFVAALACVALIFASCGLIVVALLTQ
jgi:hypothetical protein